MGSNIHNYSEYLKDEEGNKDNEGLMSNQKRLHLETMKIKKPDGRNRKINSRKKSSW